jgi:hypothetical protein
MFLFFFLQFLESHSVRHKTNQSWKPTAFIRASVSKLKALWPLWRCAMHVFLFECSLPISRAWILYRFPEACTLCWRCIGCRMWKTTYAKGLLMEQRNWQNYERRFPQMATDHRCIAVVIPYYFLPNDFLIPWCSEVRERDSPGQCFRELRWLAVSRRPAFSPYSLCIYWLSLHKNRGQNVG